MLGRTVRGSLGGVGGISSVSHKRSLRGVRWYSITFIVEYLVLQSSSMPLYTMMNQSCRWPCDISMWNGTRRKRPEAAVDVSFPCRPERHSETIGRCRSM